MSPQVSDPDLTIWLIHGTFGENPSWITLYQESFRKELARDGLQPEFRMSRWGGENTPDGRVAGGRKLAEELEQAKGSGNNFLVGHSHGGNVILYAFKELSTSKKIAGIALMATPYLDISARNVNKGFDVLRLLGAIVAFFLALPIALIVASLMGLPVSEASLGLALIAIGSTVGTFSLIHWVIRDRMHRRSCAEAKRLSTCSPALGKVPLLSVNVDRDEAQGLLEFHGWFGNSPIALFNFLSNSVLTCGRIFGVAVVFLVLVAFYSDVVLAAYNALLRYLEIDALKTVDASIADLFLYGVEWGGQMFVWTVPVFICLAIVILIVQGFRGSFVGFGGGILQHLLVNIKLAAVPPGSQNARAKNFKVREILPNYRISDAILHWDLLHNALVNNRNVASYVADWISARHKEALQTPSHPDSARE